MSTPERIARRAELMRREDLIEACRKALMTEHSDDWDMDTVSEAAHISVDAVLAVPAIRRALAAADALVLVPARCPYFGHWEPWGALTEADRPERYADPRTRRVDCADEQCQNPGCISYIRCNHWSHAVAEALADQSTPAEEGS